MSIKAYLESNDGSSLAWVDTFNNKLPARHLTIGNIKTLGKTLLSLEVMTNDFKAELFSFLSNGMNVYDITKEDWYAYLFAVVISNSPSTAEMAFGLNCEFCGQQATASLNAEVYERILKANSYKNRIVKDGDNTIEFTTSIDMDDRFIKISKFNGHEVSNISEIPASDEFLDAANKWEESNYVMVYDGICKKCKLMSDYQYGVRLSDAESVFRNFVLTTYRSLLNEERFFAENCPGISIDTSSVLEFYTRLRMVIRDKEKIQEQIKKAEAKNRPR